MLERRRNRPSARRRVRPRSAGSRGGRFAWFVVVFGVISAGALAIYGLMNGGFRPDAEWRRLAAELRERNEPLVFAEVVPPELPADRNFFSAPVFAGAAGTEPPGELLQKIALPVNGLRAGELLTATSQPDGTARLDPIAEAMAAENLLDADYLLPADRVVAGIRKLGISFEPLSDAARIPGARFPADYSKALPALPHLTHVERLGDWLAIDALARIATGNGTAATEDVLLIGRLADALATEPFLASQRVRRQLLGIAAGCVRTGIDAAAFSDESLAQLSAMLGRVRLLEDFGWAIRGERAALNSIIDGELAAETPEAMEIPAAWLGGSPGELPPGELRARRPAANAAAQAFLDQLANPSGIVASALLPPAGIPAPPRLAQLADEAGIFAQVQAYVSQALIACALERYRLANGTYPATLDALSPGILSGIPVDPMTGRPPAYQKGGDAFTLTCAGWDTGSPWIWKS